MANYTATPKMDFITAVKTCFNKYICFTGRARRSEYWWFWLFTFLLSMVTSWISDWVNYAVSLAVFLPSLAVQVRRLHDTGRSGWLLLAPYGLLLLGAVITGIGAGVEVGFLAILGSIVMFAGVCGFIWILILTIYDSNPEPNRYGASPKYVEELV